MPISGRDVLLINQVSFYDDPIRFTSRSTSSATELEERVKAHQGIVPEEHPPPDAFRLSHGRA